MSKRLFCFAVEYTESLSIFNITVNMDEEVDRMSSGTYLAKDGLTKEAWRILDSPLQVLAMDHPADHHTVYPRFRDELLHCRGGAFAYNSDDDPELVEKAKRHILHAVTDPVSEVCANLYRRVLAISDKILVTNDQICQHH